MFYILKKGIFGANFGFFYKIKDNHFQRNFRFEKFISESKILKFRVHIKHRPV